MSVLEKLTEEVEAFNTTTPKLSKAEVAVVPSQISLYLGKPS